MGAIQKFSIRAQVEEARRELLRREADYPYRVKHRRMKPAAAEYYIACQRAIVATLEWTMDNEALLKAAVAAVRRPPRHEEESEAA